MVIIKKSLAILDKTLLREHYMKMKKINSLIIQPNYVYSSPWKNNCCEVAQMCGDWLFGGYKEDL
ncbi:MAG: hypothetical protein JSV59_08155 [Flavobacteriaceae bacterium]|nr:MAG: hypothetical protein JSV59_08155 [Flavobacteriaceae bacterium]